MKSLLVEEISFRGIEMKVWLTKPESEKSGYHVTVDGETIADGATAEEALENAQSAMA